MRVTLGHDVIPRSFRNRHFGGGYLRVAAEQERREFLAKIFDRTGRRVPRKRVHRILHRVRRKDFAVAAVREAGLEIALKQDLDGPFAELMPAIAVPDSNQANPRLAVTIFGEFNHSLSFLDRWYSRWD